MPKEPEVFVAEKLREAFTQSKETYASLSRRTGIPASSLQRWLNRQPDLLTFRTIRAIAAAVGVDGLKLIAEAAE